MTVSASDGFFLLSRYIVICGFKPALAGLIAKSTEFTDKIDDKQDFGTLNHHILKYCCDPKFKIRNMIEIYG